MVWYSHLFKNFPQFVLIHRGKGFSVVNEAEIDDFLEFSCFFCDPADVANLISGFSAFSNSSLYTWKFLVHVLLNPDLNVWLFLVSLGNEHDFMVAGTFFGIALLWDWNKYRPFPVMRPLLSFSNLLPYPV